MKVKSSLRIYKCFNPEGDEVHTSLVGPKLDVINASSGQVRIEVLGFKVDVSAAELQKAIENSLNS